MFKTVNYTVCRPIQETHYKTCVYTVCRPVQRVKTRCVPYTYQVPVQHTVIQCQADTEMVPVRSARTSKSPTRSAGRSRRPAQGMPLHRPGARAPHRDANLLLHGMPPGERDDDAGMPLHRLPPGPDHLVQDRQQDLLPDGHRDGLPRSVRKGLRAQDDLASLSAAPKGIGCAAVLCSRQVGLHQRMPLRVPGNVVRKDGLLPAHRDRERRVHGLRDAGRPQAGSVHRLQEGSLHRLRASSGHDLPDGRRGMRQAGAR